LFNISDLANVTELRDHRRLSLAQENYPPQEKIDGQRRAAVAIREVGISAPQFVKIPRIRPGWLAVTVLAVSAYSATALANKRGHPRCLPLRSLRAARGAPAPDIGERSGTPLGLQSWSIVIRNLRLRLNYRSQSSLRCL